MWYNMDTIANINMQDRRDTEMKTSDREFFSELIDI